MFSQLFDCCLLLFKPLYLAVHFLFMNIKLCCFNFDPIYDAPAEITRTNYQTQLPAYRKERAKAAEETLHKYFSLHVGVFLVIFIDTLIILASNDFHYIGNQLPELFTHRMFPDHYVTQGDQYILWASIGSFGIALVLWRRPWLEDRYAMYFVYGPEMGERCLIVNGKVWDKDNAERIYQTRRLALKTYVPIGFISWFVCFSYFFSNFIQKPFTDPKYYFEVFLFLPIISWCFMLCVCLMFYHFFVATNYPLMKQNFLRRQMATLIEKLRSPKKRSALGFGLLCHEFHSLNRALAYQVKEIRGYNRFWSHILSILFICEIYKQVYLLYGVLVNNNEESTVFNAYFAIQLAVLLTAVLTRCSLVDKNNDRFYLGNVSSCIHFQLHYRKLSARKQLQIETIATNRNFSKACFRLSNGYRLDSNAANLVLYIVSSFFLTICRRNRKNARFAQKFGNFGRFNGDALLEDLYSSFLSL